MRRSFLLRTKGSGLSYKALGPLQRKPAAARSKLAGMSRVSDGGGLVFSHDWHRGLVSFVGRMPETFGSESWRLRSRPIRETSGQGHVLSKLILPLSH